MLFLIAKWLFLNLRLGTAIIEEFLPKLPFWPSLVVVVVASVFTFGEHKGQTSCEEAHKKADQKMEKKHDTVQKRTDSLSDTQLNNRLRKYQRD